MSYARVEDIPASWERYQEIAESVRRPPAGLLLHVAGPTDEGFRIIEVWESEAAWRDFAAQADDAPARTDPIVRSRIVVRVLHAVHTVVGRSRRLGLTEVIEQTAALQGGRLRP